MAFIPKGEHMLRKLREARDEEGFTLIELLVVVLIIGILAAIAIPVFLNQREKAFRDAAASDLRNGAIVMEDYFSDNAGIYPADVTAAGLQTSDNVVVNTEVYDAGGYCLDATHGALTGEIWVYNASGGVATAQVEHFESGGTACTAGP